MKTQANKSNIITAIDPATKTDIGCKIEAEMKPDGSLYVLSVEYLPPKGEVK